MNTKFYLRAALAALLVVASLVVISVQQSKLRAAEAERAELKDKLASAEARLQDLSTPKDWPWLKRYKEENARAGAPREAETRVVFIGDSITDYWDNAEYGGFFPGKPYLNRGISGQTTEQMLARFRQDVIALRPRAAVIAGGINDLYLKTESDPLDNLASMAELARLHQIEVVLASALPVNDYSRAPDGKPIVRSEQIPPGKIVELNQRIKEYASAQGFTYLDYYSAMVDAQGMLKAELADDGLHPNARGYAVMQPLAEQAVEKAVRKR